MLSLSEIHEKNGKFFIETLYEEGALSRSFACRMWDAMTGGEEDCDNCLGENFNQLIHTLKDDFFEHYSPSSTTRVEFYFTTYLLWLYLFVERVDFIFEVINNDKSKLFADYYFANFKVCRNIKKWANFIKHPKEFVFSHWPTYMMQGESLPNREDIVIIDNKFVETNYSKAGSSVKELENCSKVIVLIPDLVTLNRDFCKELNTFFDFVCDNKIVSEYLKKKTTIRNSSF